MKEVIKIPEQNPLDVAKEITTSLESRLESLRKTAERDGEVDYLNLWGFISSALKEIKSLKKPMVQWNLKNNFIPPETTNQL